MYVEHVCLWGWKAERKDFQGFPNNTKMTPRNPMTVQKGLRELGKERLHLAAAFPYCSITVCQGGWVKDGVMLCSLLRETEPKETFLWLWIGGIYISHTYGTNMFLLQEPSVEGQVCCLETKRWPPTTEITQTRCDIRSSAVATSRDWSMKRNVIQWLLGKRTTEWIRSISESYSLLSRFADIAVTSLIMEQHASTKTLFI